MYKLKKIIKALAAAAVSFMLCAAVSAASYASTISPDTGNVEKSSYIIVIVIAGVLAAAAVVAGIFTKKKKK
ncbi:MAG: hypothetical protein ACI4JJ_06725 [Huintestinicola sp.]